MLCKYEERKSLLEQMEEIEQVKRKTIYFLEDFQSIAREEKKYEFVEKVNYFITDIEKNRFIVSVLAEWNIGKSTFINAILGENLLTAKNKETTAAICEISYGEEKKIKIYFNNGRELEEYSNVTKEKLQEVLQKYSTTDGENVEQAISKVEIEYPLELCKHGVTIVDTPGINSLNEIRENITYNFIPYSDVVIMLIDCEQSGSLKNKLFIEKIRDHKKKNIFFVINKIDQLDEEEILEAEKGLKEALCENEIHEAHIFPLSSYYALIGKQIKDNKIDSCKLKGNRKIHFLDETGNIRGFRSYEDYKYLIKESRLETLETALGDFLSKTDKKFELLTKGLSYISEMLNKDIKNSIEEKLNAVNGNTDLKDISKAIEVLNEEKCKLKEKEEQIVWVINETEEKINLKINTLTLEDIIKKMKNYIDQSDINRLKTELKPWLEVELKKYMENVVDVINKDMKKSEVHAINLAIEFFENIGLKIKRALTSHEVDYNKEDIIAKEALTGATVGAIGGGLGVTAAAFLLVAHPPLMGLVILAGAATAIGGFLGIGGGAFKGIKEWLGQEKKKKEALKKDLEGKLWDSLDSIKQELKKNTNEHLENVKKSIKKEMSDKLDSLEQNLLSLKETKDLKEEEIQKREDELTAKLNRIQNLLTDIYTFMTEKFCDYTI